MKRQPPLDTRDAETEIIERLRAAGHKGLTRSVLTAKRQKLFAMALQRMEKQGQVANLGSLRKSLYLLLDAQDSRSLAQELASRSILAKAIPGKPILHSRTALKKGLPCKVQEQVTGALKMLVEKRSMIPLKYGGADLFLHASSLADCLAAAGGEAGQQVSPVYGATSVDSAAMREAYDRLAQKSRSVYIKIAELQAATAIPMDRLKAWLREECRQQRIVPGEGEYTLATAADRLAALSINGVPHLFVKFVGSAEE